MSPYIPGEWVAVVRRGADAELRQVLQRGRQRRGQVAVEHGELHEAVEQPQRLVDGDMLLRLARKQVREQ